MSTATANVLLGATLTEEQARIIYAQGEEAVVFALLEMAKLLAEQKRAEASSSHQTPATPSGLRPIHQKSQTTSRRRKKPGRKPDHPGSRRPRPTRIDRTVEHQAEVCPKCSGPLCRCQETRTRYVEDIPVVQPVVTEHVIHRDWCPACEEKVEPVVPDALPGAMLGNRVLVLSAWLRYGLAKAVEAWLPKSTDDELFPGGWHLKAAKMLREDLAKAKIPVETAEGEVDFHALRVTYGTNLARAGISPAIAQQLMRHSDIKLTLEIYTKFGTEEVADAVEKLG